MIANHVNQQNSNPPGIQKKRSTLYRNSAIRRRREDSPMNSKSGNYSTFGSNSSLDSANFDTTTQRRASLRRQMLVRQGSAPQHIQHAVVMGTEGIVSDEEWSKTQSVPASPLRTRANGFSKSGSNVISDTPSSNIDIHGESNECSSSDSQSNLDTPFLQRNVNGVVKGHFPDNTREKLRQALLQGSQHPPKDKKEDYFDRLNPHYDSLISESEDSYDHLELSIKSETGVNYDHLQDLSRPSIPHSHSLAIITDRMRSGDGHHNKQTPPPKPPRVMSNLYFNSDYGSSQNAPPKPSRGPTPQHIKMAIERWNKEISPRKPTGLTTSSTYASFGGNFSNNSNNNNNNSDEESEFDANVSVLSDIPPTSPLQCSSPLSGNLGLRCLLSMDSPANVFSDCASEKDDGFGDDVDDNQSETFIELLDADSRTQSPIPMINITSSLTESDITDISETSGTRCTHSSSAHSLISRISHTTIGDEVFQKQFSMAKGQRLRKRTRKLSTSNETHLHITSEEVHMLCAHALGHVLNVDRRFESSGLSNSELTTGPPLLPPRSSSLNDSLTNTECKQLIMGLYSKGSIKEIKTSGKNEDTLTVTSTCLSPAQATPPVTITVSNTSPHLHSGSLSDTSAPPIPQKNRTSLLASAQKLDQCSSECTSGSGILLEPLNDNIHTSSSSIDMGNLLTPYQSYANGIGGTSCHTDTNSSKLSLYKSTTSLLSPSDVCVFFPHTQTNKECEDGPSQVLHSGSHSSPNILPCSSDTENVAWFSSDKETHHIEIDGHSYATVRRRKLSPPSATYGPAPTSTTTHSEANQNNITPSVISCSDLSLSLKPFQQRHFVDGSGQYNYIVWYKGDNYSRVWRSQTGDYRTVTA